MNRKTLEVEKSIYVAKPVEMSREEREAFRRQMMAKYSKVIEYLGRRQSANLH